MLTIGEREFGSSIHLGKEYYVLCPHCGGQILFYTYPARTCVGRQGCGKPLPIDPKELMSCSKVKILYHFEKVGI